MISACSEMVSPVIIPSSHNTENVTKPSPLPMRVSLTGRKPIASTGATPVSGSIDWNIQYISFLFTSMPAFTSSHTPNESARS